MFITARIRRMGKVLFSQVSVCSHLGVPHLHPIILPLVPCPFWGYPSDWSQFPFAGYHSPKGVLQSQAMVVGTPGWNNPLGQVKLGYPLARTGVLPWPGQDMVPPPPPDRTAERALATRRASCDHTGELSCYSLLLTENNSVELILIIFRRHIIIVFITTPVNVPISEFDGKSRLQIIFSHIFKRVSSDFGQRIL